jgi:hypothetical protein
MIKQMSAAVYQPRKSGYFDFAGTDWPQKEYCHQPVEDARLGAKLCPRFWRAHFSVSAVETALGSLGSPSRRVNDCE